MTSGLTNLSAKYVMNHWTDFDKIDRKHWMYINKLLSFVYKKPLATQKYIQFSQFLIY